MSTLDSVLAQYEKNKKKTTNTTYTKVSDEERLKKYFNAVLPKGVETLEKRIRILPTKDGSTPFVEANFHDIYVDGKSVKLYDPEQDGERSPLNETKEILEMSTDPKDVEVAKDYRSKKFYIVKLIDRDKENDGPKFWRFKHNGKGEGTLDKIIPIWRNKGDITDPIEGRDLILTLSLMKSNKGNEYTVVSAVIPEDKGPLHSDPEIAKQWMEDPMTWLDAFPKKSVEYLEIIASGDVPKWNNDLKKWVPKSNGETGEISLGSPNVSIEDPQSDDDVSDELPF